MATDQTQHTSSILQQAETNDDGELIYEHKIQAKNGASTQVEINATRLFRPGRRKSGSVELLVTEAKLAEQGEIGGNPAKPANADIAKQAIEKIEGEGLSPAWRTVERGEFP